MSVSIILSALQVPNVGTRYLHAHDKCDEVGNGLARLAAVHRLSVFSLHCRNKGSGLKAYDTYIFIVAH